jgi:hypothetical protein
MTSIFRFSLYVILICGVLFFTNPEKKDFIAWATLKLYSYGNQQAGAIGAGIAGLVGGPVLNKSITRKNYYLFSVFTIDNPVVAKAVTESAENSGVTTIVGFFSPFMYIPVSQDMKNLFQTSSSTKNITQQNSAKNNSNQLDLQISKNQSIAAESKISCTPKNNDVKVYVNPSISSDTLDQVIGLSWSFVHHSTEKMGGGSFYKGHLVSPRGGHQREVVFIEPLYWDCTN